MTAILEIPMKLSQLLKAGFYDRQKVLIDLPWVRLFSRFLTFLSKKYAHCIAKSYSEEYSATYKVQDIGW